jgi:DNA-binding XRE family transcriptional regulator
MSRYLLEQQLKDAGNNIRRVREERTTVHRVAKQAVREATQRGMSKTRIAELAGVSRQTVYDLLKD